MGKLAIIGLGLIGGSMGLALKRAEPENTEIVGYDRDYETAERAAKAGAVQHIYTTLEEAVSSATMVIIATPIISMEKVMRDIAPFLQKGTLVTDVASTKGEVMRWAKENLPAGVHFVGGHPMAGREKSGPEAAQETLFDGRPYCIVPAVNASPGAVTAILGLVEALGAEPFFLDAQEHDAYAAAISHVPLVVSIALFKLAYGSTAWPELASMAGPAFYDLTRLASGEPVMSHDIFLTNKDNLLHWLDCYIVELEGMADLIREGNAETLFRAVAETQLQRENFLINPPKREDPIPGVEMPNAGEALMGALAGSLWTNRAQDITKELEERLAEREHEQRLRRQE